MSVSFGNKPGGPGLTKIKEFDPESRIGPSPGMVRAEAATAAKATTPATPAAPAVPATPAPAPAPPAAPATPATPTPTPAPVPATPTPAPVPATPAPVPATPATPAGPITYTTSGTMYPDAKVKRPDSLNNEVSRPRPARNSRKKLNNTSRELPGTSTLVPFVNNNNNRSVSTTDTEDNNSLPYNKELCTLLRFGPYDSNSEYVELDSEVLKTNSFQFHEMALGQAEMRKYYGVTSQNELETLQNVFGVTSLNTNPYFVDYKEIYQTKPCKFKGIEHVLTAIQKRRETLQTQVDAESDNAKKKRLRHQLEWFTETVEFLKNASKYKDCVDDPRCGKKAASVWPFGKTLFSGSGSESESGTESDDCCFFDITLLYKIVVLINHLQNTAPSEFKEKLKSIPIKHLLTIAQNPTIKNDMTGHLKSVLGYLLEYLMAIKSSSGVQGTLSPGSGLDPNILLKLYKALDGSNQTKTSITIEEFMTFIGEINLKLRRLIAMESGIRRINMELEQCRKELEQCREGHGGSSLDNTSNLSIEIGTIKALIDKIIGSLESLRRELEAQIAALQTELANTQATLEALRTERADDLKKMEGYQELIDSLRSELAAAIAALEGLRGRNKINTQAEIKGLKNELAATVQALEDLRKICGEKDIRIAALEEKVNSILENLESIKGELSKASSQIDSLKSAAAEKDQRTSEFVRGLIDKISKLQSDVYGLRKQGLEPGHGNGELLRQIEEIQAELAKARSQTDSLKSTASEKDQRTSEFVRGLIDKISKLQSDIYSLRKQGLNSGSDELLRQLEEAQAELAKALSELDKVKQTTGSTIKDLLAKIDELNAKLASLEGQDDSKNKAKIDAVLKELEEARVALGLALSELDELKTSQSSFIQTLIDKISKLEADILALRNQGLGQDEKLRDWENAFYAEFNKNVEKDELIRIYGEFMDVLGKTYSGSLDKIKDLLRQLREADSNYDALIKTLEEEIQKDPVIMQEFFVYIIPLVETQQVVIEDLTAKAKLRDLAAKLKALGAEKDAKINKLRGERDKCNEELATLKAKHVNVMADLERAKAELQAAIEALAKLRKKPNTSDSGTSTETTTGEAGTSTETTTGEAGTQTNLRGLSIEELQAKVKTLDEKVKNLKLKQVELETQIRNLERNSLAKQGTIDGQLARISDLERQLSELKTANIQEINRLTGVLDGVSGERNVCRKNLDQAKAMIETQKGVITTSEASLQKCRSDLAFKDKQIAELATKIGEEGASAAVIAALQLEKKALEVERDGLRRTLIDRQIISDTALRVCETGRREAEIARDEALGRLKAATEASIAAAAAHAAELARRQTEYEAALARAEAAAATAAAASEAAIAAAVAARGVAEAAAAAAKTGEVEAVQRATAADAAAVAANAARDAAVAAGAAATAEAARSKEEAAAAKAEAAAAMTDAAAIKADGERKLAAAAAAEAAAEAANAAAQAALAEAARLHNEAERLRAEAERLKGIIGQGKNANISAARAAAEAAEARARAAEAAAIEAQGKAAIAIAAAEARVAAAEAEAAAARAEAEAAKAAAEKAKGEAKTAEAAKVTAEAAAQEAKGQANEAEAARAAAEAARAAAEAAAKASAAEAAAARAEAEAARAEADAANAASAAAAAEAAASKTQKNASNAARAEAEARAIAAAEAATKANAKAAKAESDAAAAIAAAGAEAERQIADMRAASQAEIDRARAELEAAKAASRSEADARVAAAKRALQAAEAAQTAAEVALHNLRVELEAAQAASAASTARAEKAEGELDRLKQSVTDLSASLAACNAEKAELKADNAKTHALLDKLLALVILDGDGELTESSTINDFKKLKEWDTWSKNPPGSGQTAKTLPDRKTDPEGYRRILRGIISKAIGEKLTAGGIPDDIFSIYSKYDPAKYDQTKLCDEIREVLYRAVGGPQSITTGSNINGTIKKGDTGLNPNEVTELFKLRESVKGSTRVTFALRGKVPDDLLNHSVSFTTSKPQIVSHTDFSEMGNIPLGILAIKFLQACGDGGGGAGGAAVPIRDPLEAAYEATAASQLLKPSTSGRKLQASIGNALGK